MKSNAFRSTWSLEHLDLSHNPKLMHLESKSFTGLNQLKILDMSYCRLQYLNPDAFGDLKQLVTLNVRSNALTMIDSKVGSFVVNLQVLDVRDNPLACNCSIDWVRSHLSRQGNHSSSSSSSTSTWSSFSTSPVGSPFATSSSPSSAALESSTTANAATTTALLLTSNYNSKGKQPTEVGSSSSSFSSSSSSTSSASTYSSSSSASTVFASASPFYLGQVETTSSILYSTSSGGDFTEEHLWSTLQDVKCFQPSNLQGKRLIDLESESIGCNKNESMKPIVIIALTSGIILGIFMIIIIRFRLYIITFFRRKHKHAGKRPHDFMSSHPSFLPSPITVSSKLNPTTVTTLHINNNRKVYGFDPILSHTLHSSNRPYLGSSASTLGRISFDELGPLCAKPEFIYVHNNTMVGTKQQHQQQHQQQQHPQQRSKIQLAMGRTIVNGIHGGIGGGTGDHLESLEQAIYPPRHAINNLNNPYEVVPIVPQFAPPSAFQSPWTDGNRTHSPFVDSYSDQLYEEANCPLTSNVKIPSTEL